MIKKLLFIFYLLISFSFLTEKAYGKKRIKIYGKYFECKAPKNSFERTRGVRNRICILKKTDKEIIDKMMIEKKNYLKEKY